MKFFISDILLSHTQLNSHHIQQKMSTDATEENKQLLTLNTGKEKTIKEINIDQFQYYHITHRIQKNQPIVVEYLDANSTIYGEYMEIMMQRMNLFPNVSYNMLTRDSYNDVMDFLDRFPNLAATVNVVPYTEKLSALFKQIKDFPYLFLTDQNKKIIYKGSITSDLFLHKLAYLNTQCNNMQFDMQKSQIQQTSTQDPKILAHIALGSFLKPQFIQQFSIKPASRSCTPSSMYGQSTNVGMQKQRPLKHAMTRSTSDLFDIRDTSQKLKSEYEALHLSAPSINSNAIARFRFMKNMNQLDELKK